MVSSLRPSSRCLAALLAGALAFAPPLAPAQVDNLPRLGDAAGDELSPAMERRIGESIVREMRRRGAIDDAEHADHRGRATRDRRVALEPIADERPGAGELGVAIRELRREGARQGIEARRRRAQLVGEACVLDRDGRDVRELAEDRRERGIEGAGVEPVIDVQAADHDLSLIHISEPTRPY